jgi:type I restriction enzyme S subunit
MTWPLVPLGEVLIEFKDALGDGEEPTVLTLTEGRGFMAQSDRFKKRLAVADTKKYKVIRRGDIAFNPYLLWAGAIAHNDGWGIGLLSPLYPTFRTQSHSDSRYVWHMLRSQEALSRFDRISFGSVPRKRRASVPDFLSVEIPLPPLPEQRRIASILDQADKSRFRRREAIKALDDIVESELESVYEHTEKTVPLMTLVEEFRYGTSVKSGPTGVPVLRIPNVSRRVLDLTEIKYVSLTDAELIRLALREDDLLVVRSNGNREIVGATVRVPAFPSPHVFASYLIRMRPRETTNAAFVSKYLSSSRGRAGLRAGATTSAGQYNINTKTLAALPIALPSTAIQDNFVANLRRLNSLLELHEKHLAILDELFASLQHRAFEGTL